MSWDLCYLLVPSIRKADWCFCHQNKPPTAKVMITAIRQARPSSAILVPSMLKDICNIDEGLDVLSSLQDVWYGGGPLDRACGDKVSRVTRLLCGYGSTEMMTVFTLLPCRAEDWEYLEWHPEAGVVMEEVTDTTSEMIIKRKSKSEWQSVFYNFPQLSEWRSDDLFERHPSNVKLWRHIGRKDDLLVLSNGEKINPTGIEASIGQHPMVRDALIFGSGRFQVGVLLEVDEEQNKQNDDNRIGQIWPTIDKTNKSLPGHAKIWESMIIFATLEKPFERNLKGSIKRQATLELYETEIEKLYETQSKQPDEQSSSQDESNCSLQLIDKVIGLVKSVLQYESDPAVDQDLFDLGLDSLKALELAKRIEESIVGDNTESQHCDTETIYTYPTIEKLAGALSGEADRMDGPSSSNKGFQPSREETMSSLVHKYTRLLDESPRSHSQMKPTFVLTGSTGQLGSYVLAHLLTTQATNKIYCFNRSEDAKARQRSRFQNMGLNADDLLDARVEFVCCTFDVDKLGLSADQFDDVRQSMTHFIHCAWPVDFKKSIETFEKTAIIGMVNCINFVAGAKQDPKFVFISSIASVGNWPAICSTADQEHCLVPERHITDNSCPSRQGYGESKHVATCILARAVQTLDIRATVVRVGQLCGPQDGSTEWKKSGKSIGIHSVNLGH